jgi:methyl-accepting chemotaxis protein
MTALYSRRARVAAADEPYGIEQRPARMRRYKRRTDVRNSKEIAMGSLLHTIRAKLIASIVLLAVAAVIIGGVGIYNLSQTNDRMSFIVNVAAKRSDLTRGAEAEALKLYRYQKNHILEDSDDKMSTWESAIQLSDATFNKILDDWEKVASEEGKKELASVRTNYADFMRINARVLQLSRQHKTVEARTASSTEARDSYNKLEEHLNKAESLAEEFMLSQFNESASAYSRTKWIMLAVTLIGLGLSFSFGFFMVQQTTRRIAKVSEYIKDVAEGEGDLTKRIHVEHNDELGDLSNHFNTFMEKLHDIISQVAASTEHIASANEEISSSATQVAQSAETQKDQTSQVATAMQEMSSTVTQVSDNSRQASENAKEAGDLARTGGIVVSDTVKVIQGVADATRDTSTKIEELGRSSDQIGQIIGVIDDIADQTNLLALNAAIEAARAGEQGRGFAVVADEVRKLAERTTQATKEIAQMIKTIQEETKKAVDAMKSGTDKVDAGVESAREAGSALEKIIHSADGVQDMVTHIATAATEQASATEQVNSNMEEIAKMVHQSSIGAQESARACQDLSNLALDLQQLVGRFKLADRREQQRTTKSVRRKPASANSYVPHEKLSEPVGMVQ